ncbi:MAG TPA: 2,3-epoxybenzoyl-CoA dihydrolase [Burkholderiales bacterium]|nr:2,3-epoxybenzoyl-CoA dihydrolase [Burkholderiales bacterium]
MDQPATSTETPRELVTYDTHPDRYLHWRLSFEGAVATLRLDVNEERPLRPGYKLKLNSYDLGVDIELYDALQRIRFEHPEIGSVIVTSGKERMFCAGANIFMLASSSHAWKVNFCKFTNETRCGIEDASAHSRLKFIAACNGITAGGGYELALACDEIVLIDDRSSAVSMPEVPLLGVLPGTGGLTRMIDKRKVRRDLADMFCTTTEGVRGARAREWGLVDAVVKPQQFAEHVKRRAQELAALSDRPRDGKGVALPPVARAIDETGYHYEYVDVRLDPRGRSATIAVAAPKRQQPNDIGAIFDAGASWWPLQMARELDDAILMLRTNDLGLGTWILRTRGDPALVFAVDAALQAHAQNWFVREVTGMLRRTYARLEVSSRTLFALIDRGSCFAGTLFELALAADRSYMLALPEDDAGAPTIVLSGMNFGPYVAVHRLPRIAARFYGDPALIDRAQQTAGHPLGAARALELGLVTTTPDELDWDDEIRLALEERASLSPDALTGMEANLRFGPAETMQTRIYGRLSGWQNWIFRGSNAVGESGALKVYGSGKKAKFNWERT